MSIRNILSAIFGGGIGAILLNLFQYVHYFNLGNFGGYVILLVLILSMILALVFDYKWNKKSTFVGRISIGFIAFMILLLSTSYSDFKTIELGAVAMILLLGLGMSVLIAQIFKY